MKKYPYQCKIIGEDKTFTPTMIDYDNRMVWHQKGQASNNGEWLGFDEVEFIANQDFESLTSMKNTLISIGYLGIKRCYLNISLDEAIKRFCISEECTKNEFDKQYAETVEIFDFVDEFNAYDVGEI